VAIRENVLLTVEEFVLLDRIELKGRVSKHS